MVPGCARGARTAVGPTERATAPPKMHQAGGPAPSRQLCLGSPSADTGTEPRSAGDSGSFPELLLLLPLGSTCPTSCAEEIMLLGQPLGTQRYTGKGYSTMGTKAHWHSAYKDTGLAQTNPSAHFGAPSRSEWCPQQPGVMVPARDSTGHQHPAVPRAGSMPSCHAFHHHLPG